VRFLVCGLLMVVLGLDACGGRLNGAESTPSTGTRLAIATDPQASTAEMAGLVTGTIQGTVNGDGTACFRIAEDPQLPMVWPKGYFAEANPLRVMGGNGNTVAVDGHQVKLGGGTADLNKSEVILGCGEATQVLAVY
jgi:hypothetical protein